MGLGASRKTVLVTGAAGFLGSHLCDRLLAEGYQVVGLDNLMTGNLANLESAARDPHFHLEIGDVRETLHVYSELIFNLACPASPVHYQSDPHATWTTSVVGALRLVEHARSRRCRIVHTSTSEVYGDPLVHPQTEDYWGNVNPIGERSCYDEGKRAAETLFMDSNRAYGTDVRIVRIFNTYGPRMAFADGRVVSNFVIQALKDRPVTVYGDGKQTRSFCYVSDMIEGLVRAGHSEKYDSPVNIGNPDEFTMLELVEAVSRVAKKKLEVSFRPLPPDDPKRRCPDISKARRLLGFEPKVKLAQGIEQVYGDFKSRLESEPDAARGV